MILNKDQIKEIIPHRYPFLFLDSIKIIEKGISGIGYVNFSEDVDFFKGHFPGNPIVPGVIIVEALAQAAGIVAGLKYIKEKRTVLFMSISSAKFRKSVKPNENLSLHIQKMNQVKNAYKFFGLAKIDTKIVTESVFTAMII